MASSDKIKRLCLDAMLLAVSMLLSYLEAILPLNILIPLPGFKLGLCNIIITLVFAVISPLDALFVSLSRISLMSLLFGNASSLIFSLLGGILSYIGLWLLIVLGRSCFSMIGVSVGCAALHNIGQLAAAAILFGVEAALGYFPMLLFASLIFGTVTGILLEAMLPKFKKIIKST